MLQQWSIRRKTALGLGLLAAAIVILAGAGIYTGYAYRYLVRALRTRVAELPVAAELSREVGELRMTLSRLRGLQARPLTSSDDSFESIQIGLCRDEFHNRLIQIRLTLGRYESQLESKLREGSTIADNQKEWETVDKIEAVLEAVYQTENQARWTFQSQLISRLDEQLESVQRLATELPSHLHDRLGGLADDVRAKYRAIILGSWFIGGVAAVLLALFLQLYRQWIFQPIKTLLAGSRRIASGSFEYRIPLETDDEMGELARALNEMTDRFCAIRDDLDNQVRLRTRQVVRSEQLASVGFLAAGVSHEINNPLASIALCAESLENRLRVWLDPDASSSNSTSGSTLEKGSRELVANYLRMIQNEAFRCKEITEKLLDFSRTGENNGADARESTDLGGLVRDVVEMVGHLKKYRGKTIRFAPDQAILVRVNPREMKQVVLNLLTNALDSLDAEGGEVDVSLVNRRTTAEIVFQDNGCGIEPQWLEEIFEPFFTRRRTGGGTGLGLSISHRIVAEHDGELLAESPGKNQGSTFRVRLPRVAVSENQKENRHVA